MRRLCSLAFTALVLIGLLVMMAGAAYGEGLSAEWRAKLEAARKMTKPPLIQPGRAVWGQARAPVTIIKYVSFLCPDCASGMFEVKTLLARQPKEVRLILKHNTSSEQAEKIALYYEAIARQDPAKARRFAESLFLDQRYVKKNGLAAVQEMAGELGVDNARLFKDLADPALASLIQSDKQEALAYGLRLLPAYTIDGTPVQGPVPLAVLEELVRIKLKRE